MACRAAPALGIDARERDLDAAVHRRRLDLAHGVVHLDRAVDGRGLDLGRDVRDLDAPVDVLDARRAPCAARAPRSRRAPSRPASASGGSGCGRWRLSPSPSISTFSSSSARSLPARLVASIDTFASSQPVTSTRPFVLSSEKRPFFASGRVSVELALKAEPPQSPPCMQPEAETASRHHEPGREQTFHGLSSASHLFTHGVARGFRKMRRSGAPAQAGPLGRRERLAAEAGAVVGHDDRRARRLRRPGWAESPRRGGARARASRGPAGRARPASAQRCSSSRTRARTSAGSASSARIARGWRRAPHVGLATARQPKRPRTTTASTDPRERTADGVLDERGQPAREPAPERHGPAPREARPGRGERRPGAARRAGRGPTGAVGTP